MQKNLIILILLFVSVHAFSQMSIGYRYGIGSHGAYFEPTTLQTYQVGYTRASHGLVFIYNSEKNVGLQIEANYAQKGWREESKTSVDTFYTRNLDYLEIPFYSHFEIGHGMLRPTINVGPYIAWQLNDSYDQHGFEDQLENSFYEHYDQETRTFGYGIKAAVGLRLHLGKISIFGEARYDIEIAGSRDIFIDRPDDIKASRLTEISGVFGIQWNIVPQKESEIKEGYKPKEDIYLNDY